MNGKYSWLAMPQGRTVHAVIPGSRRALCGSDARDVRRWSEPTTPKRPCRFCAAQLAPPGEEVGANQAERLHPWAAWRHNRTTLRR